MLLRWLYAAFKDLFLKCLKVFRESGYDFRKMPVALEVPKKVPMLVIEELQAMLLESGRRMFAQR